MPVSSYGNMLILNLPTFIFCGFLSTYDHYVLCLNADIISHLVAGAC